MCPEWTPGRSKLPTCPWIAWTAIPKTFTSCGASRSWRIISAWPVYSSPSGEAPGRYTIVSGHRRLAAVKELAQEAPEKWTDVPCIIETDDASPALQQLRLIYANANTRQLSSAEISDQAKQVEMLLYQLQEEGYSFPGRMRDHVAEAVGVSRSKLARLKVIRDNLIPEFEESWRAGKISEGTAYTLAQNSRERQKLIFEAQGKNKNGGLEWVSESTVRNCLEEMDKSRKLCGEIDCFRGCKCDHAAAREQRAAKLQSYSALNCRGCCRECSNLAGCKGACEYAGDVKQQQIKAARAEQAEAKAAEQARKAEAKAKEEKAIDLAAEIFRRTEELRVGLGLSVEELVGTWIAYGNDYYVRHRALPIFSTTMHLRTACSRSACRSLLWIICLMRSKHITAISSPSTSSTAL